MKSLAQTVVESAAFLELSGDDVVSPDAAVSALETIATTLGGATAEERKAVLEYCADQAAAIGTTASVEAVKRREFYLGFGEALRTHGRMKKPNQASEPTSVTVTFCADAQPAPATLVAHR